jgi:hypothetical protein
VRPAVAFFDQLTSNRADATHPTRQCDANRRLARSRLICEPLSSAKKPGVSGADTILAVISPGRMQIDPQPDLGNNQIYERFNQLYRQQPIV